MTTPDEQPENNASEPVEPKVESIYIGFGRGSYSAMKDTEDTVKRFDKFLYPESGSMPDIDCNFVDGDKVRAGLREYLKEKYGDYDGETSKLYFGRFLNPERADVPQPGDWFTDEQWEQRNKDMQYLKETYSSNPTTPDKE